MGNQGPVVVSSQGGVEVAGQGQNVATARSEQAEEKKLSVDGKKIYPTDVFADTVHLKTDLTVGSGVALTDGCVSAQHIATDAVTTEKINAGAVTAAEMTVSTLSSISANLGTVTAGTINTTNITIGTGGSAAPSTGIALTGTQFLMKRSGVTYVDLNTSGTYYFKGTIVADQITVASNASNSVNFGSSITIGGDIILGTTDSKRAIYRQSSASYAGYLIFGTTGDTTLLGDNLELISGGTNVANQAYLKFNSGACELGGAGIGNIKIDGNATTTIVGASLVFTSDHCTLSSAGALVIDGDLTVATAEKIITTGESTRHKIKTTTLNVSVTGTGAFATGTWTHGWNTGTQTVRFFCTAQDYDTTKVTGISNVRIERTSTTTCKVEFLVPTYSSTETVTFDVMAIGPA